MITVYASLKRNVQVGSKIYLVPSDPAAMGIVQSIVQFITRNRIDHMNALGPTGFSSSWRLFPTVMKYCCSASSAKRIVLQKFK